MAAGRGNDPGIQPAPGVSGMGAPSRLSRMRGQAARLLLAMLLAVQFQGCNTWFMYGELGWRREQGSNAVHFSLHTSWDRRGFPTEVSRLTASADVESFNSAWAAGIAGGRGAVLPVPEGETATVRRAIAFGDGHMLPSNASQFNFIITRLDEEVVHASLEFSHTYAAGAYTAYFEGCCRSLALQNNAGGAWHLISTVTLLDPEALASPALALPAVLHLRRPRNGELTTLRLSGVPVASEYRLEDEAGGLGFALDERLGVPYSDTVYALPRGLALSAGGELALSAAAACVGGGRCLLQAVLHVVHRNASTGIDLMIEVESQDAPRPDFAGFFVTAATTLHAPASIACGTPAFVPPLNSTYKVSACMALSELNSFACSRMIGVCPGASYAFLHPFNLPAYATCFAAAACAGGGQRLYCTDMEEVGAASNFLRVSFDSPVGSAVTAIRQVAALPEGVAVTGGCDGLGNCGGGVLIGEASSRYVDVTWTPDCSSEAQVGVFAVCFTAEDSVGRVSAPSCVVIDSRNGSTVQRLPEEGANYALPTAYLSDVQEVPTAQMGTWRLAVFRNPAHAIAEEAIISQPQVAVLDPNGKLVTSTAGMRVTASIGLNPGGGTLSGTKVVDIVDGVAAFTDLTISQEGKGYSLTFTTAGISGAMEMPRFTVLPPVRLVRVGVEPALQLVAGERVGGPPKIYLLDRDHNYVALSSRAVSVVLVGQAGLVGMTTVTAVSGVASFHDLRLNVAGYYGFRFTVAAVAGAGAQSIAAVESRNITVVAGAAALLYVVQQPCARTGLGECLDPSNVHQVAKDKFETKVALYDSYYNRIFDSPSTASCSVSLIRFPPRPISGFLQGTLNVTFVGGLARFEDLSIKEQGFYSVTFTADTGLTTIVNQTIVFDVQLPVALPPDVIQQPLSEVAGVALGGPASIVLLDSYGFQTESQRPVWLVLDASNASFNCAAQCLSAAECATTANRTCQSLARIQAGDATAPQSGVARFNAVVINRAAFGYRLQFLASDALFSFSAAFDVTHAAPSSLVLLRLPFRTLLSEPFIVQPLCSVVDSFGNVALSVSSGEVVATLHDNSSFFLVGFNRVAMRNGEAEFLNLGVDSREEVLSTSLHNIDFAFGNWTTSTGTFEVPPALERLAVDVQPLDTVAGASIGGLPAVLLYDPSGNVSTLSKKTISVRVNEDGCPDRFPAPNAVPRLVTQAEVRGLLPAAVGEPMVLTNFVAVGFPDAGSLVKVLLVDGRFECDAYPDPSVGAVPGGEAQNLMCHADGSCRAAADSSRLYLTFMLTGMSSSATLRVCAAAPGAPVAVVSLVLHQRASLKLHTLFSMVVSRGARAVPTDQMEPADAAVLWYAGGRADACNAFRTTSSDPRVAVVRATLLDTSLDAGSAYQCPHHPLTGQRYRWAASDEVLLLGTLFSPLAAHSVLYSAASCGSAPARDAFVFSDSAATRLFASASAMESQNLTSGLADGMLAGLVCMLDEDEVLGECIGLCPSEPVCPVHEPAIAFADAAQGLVLKVVSYQDGGAGDMVSPEFEGHLDARLGGNVVAIAEGSVGFKVALEREPESWVTVTVNAPPPQGYLAWDAGAEFVFGGGNVSGWDFARYQAHTFRDALMLDVSCGVACGAWPFNVTVDLVFTMHSSVPAYDGVEASVSLRRAPTSAGQAAALMGTLAGNLPRSVAVPEEVAALDAPEGDYSFCIRAGANWRVGGDAEGVEMDGALKWCGQHVSSIAAGGYHSCALTSTAVEAVGNVSCWGRNNNLQTEPPAALLQAGAKSLDVGTYHSCAVDVTGKAWCWGDNARGQRNVPAVVSIAQGGWAQLSCGTAHTCGVAANGRAFCWGDGHYGQTQIPTLPSWLLWRSVSAGFFHSCGVDANSKGYCWGAVRGTNRYDYHQTELPQPDGWLLISAGNLHSCGVLNDGRALCWGLGNEGQTTVPAVSAGVTWVQVSAGLQHSCGVTSDGVARCWGSHGLNRLLINPSAAGPWTALSAGYEHTCGLLATGRISCWGSRQYGQLALAAARPPEFGMPDARGFVIGVASPGVSNVSLVDVVLSSRSRQVALYYTLTNAASTAFHTLDVTRPFFPLQLPQYTSSALYKFGTPVRLDVTATILARAISADPEVADSDVTTQDVTVTCGAPAISPLGVMECGEDGATCVASLEFETMTDVMMSTDRNMNPFANNSIHYTVDGTDPTTASPVLVGQLEVGSGTGDANGTTRIKAITARPGASPSAVSSSVLRTRAGPVSFTSNASTLTLDGNNGTEVTVALTSPTPGASIYYTLCRPSSCATAPDPTTASFLYAGALAVNETGTVVRALAFKANLATSAVTERTYKLRLAPPIIDPMPNPPLGYLAPLYFTMTCLGGAYPLYSTDGAHPATAFTPPLILQRDVTFTAICAQRDTSAVELIADSPPVSSSYHITAFSMLNVSVAESSEIQLAANAITFSVGSTLALTVGTRITVTGLTGTLTPDDADLLISNPRLRKVTWSRATGRLELEVSSPPPPTGPLFAVTTATRCAESLAFGPGVLNAATSLGGVSTDYLDLVHGGWRQIFSVSRSGAQVPIMTITYAFVYRCSLRQRLTPSRNADGRRCDEVRWRVEYLGSETSSPAGWLEGHYAFTSRVALGRGASGAGLALDDGVWGAAHHESLVADGARPSNFWGQAVFDDVDARTGQCNTLYLGSASVPPLVDSTLRSQVFLTDVDTALIFSVTLKNAAAAQAPIAPAVFLTGTYSDPLGDVLQSLGPVTAGGAVLGAPTAFDLISSSAEQTSTLSGELTTISLTLRTNLEVPVGHTILVSELSARPDDAASVPVAARTVPEVATTIFDCDGFRSCSVSAESYVPTGAVLVSAEVDILLACSDFNAPNELVQTLTINAAPVAGFATGPWDNCEAACGVQKTLVAHHDVSAFAGGAIAVYIAASPHVDAFSCSDSSTRLVKAQVVVRARYYFPALWLPPATLKYTLRDVNVRESCGDISGWADSKGYTCGDYSRFEWCNAGGVCGGADWTCKAFQNSHNVSASEACCTCGGGGRFMIRIAFQLRNTIPAGHTAPPRVALQRPDGFVLLNRTIHSPIGGNDAPPVGLLARLSGSPWMDAAPAQVSRRRLLSAHACPAAACVTRAPLAVSWGVGDAEAYSCCRQSFKDLLQRAVAEVLLRPHACVTVALESYNASGAAAWVSVDGGTDGECVGMANNLVPALVVEALRSQMLAMEVSLAAPAEAVTLSGDILPLRTSTSVGDNALGVRNDANFAGFPARSGFAHAIEWATGRLLLLDTTLRAAAGAAEATQIMIHKACSGYTLEFGVALSNRVLSVASLPFEVTSAAPAALRVSPVPSLATAASLWPCPTPAACPSTLVVAGLYFGVTATVVDAYNNTVVNVNGSIAAILGGSTAAVYGAPGQGLAVVNGAVDLQLRISLAAAGYIVDYEHFPLRLTARSQAFSVVASPLARMVVSDAALRLPVEAGVPISPPPYVTLFDAYGNPVLEPLSVETSLVNFPGALLNQTRVSASLGAAVFPGLRIQRAASAFSLLFLADGVVATSLPFEVVHASAASALVLTLARRPAAAVATEPFTIQPRLRLRDRFGNPALSSLGFIAVTAPSLAGSLSAPLIQGVASFTDLVMPTPGGVDLYFTLEEHPSVNASVRIDVRAPLAGLRLLQQPVSTMASICMRPVPLVQLVDAAGLPVDFSRHVVKVDFAVNTFRYTQTFSCGSGGCTASTTFRYFLPAGSVLVDAFLDVDIIKSDFDDSAEEYVDFIQVNGLPTSHAPFPPGSADQCSSYHKAVDALRVSTLAQDNFLSVAAKISPAVNDFCVPRLSARAVIFGSYRPYAAETLTLVQNQNGKGIAGATALTAVGRTVAFREMAMPVAGYGYRLRFSVDAPGVASVESAPFDIFAVASSVMFTTQPGEAIAQEPLRIQPIVRFLDGLSNLVTSFEENVTISIDLAQNWDDSCNVLGCWRDLTGANRPQLLGTPFVVAAGGVAQFKGISVDREVERLRVVVRACNAQGGSCFQVQSIALLVYPPAASLLVAPLPPSAIAGDPLFIEVHIKDGAGAGAQSAAAVGVRVLGSPATLAMARADGLGFANVTAIQIPRTGNVTLEIFLPAFPSVPTVLRSIIVGAGAVARIAVVEASVDFQVAGVAFNVTVVARDRFDNPTPLAALSILPAPAGDFLLLAGASNQVAGAVAMEGGVALLTLRIDKAIPALRILFSAVLAPAARCEAVKEGVCAGGVRVDECMACSVNASVTGSTLAQVLTQTGTRLTVVLAPGGAVNRLPMSAQPTVLVETCPFTACNAVPNEVVEVSIRSVVDDCSLVGNAFCTALAGTRTVTTNGLGFARFTDLVIESSNGVTLPQDIVLQFRTPGIMLAAGAFPTTEAEAFDLLLQTNIAPTLIEPTPLLCSDEDSPLEYYVKVGSRVGITLRASDANTAPFDDLAIHVDLASLPPGALLTEDLYAGSTLLVRPEVAECGEVTNVTVQRRNVVTRKLIWAPVAYFPRVTLRYSAVEARSSGALSSCARSLHLTVCDRPRFVSPSPLDVSHEMIALAGTEVVFTVAAEDRNEDDVVEIDVVEAPGAAHAFSVSEPSWTETKLVSGLSKVRRNRVSREVTWRVGVTSLGEEASLCFRARDNQFPCGGDGLTSEDVLCIVCSLEPKAVYASCLPRIRGSSLDTRMLVTVCGDARMTGDEQCDDGNHVSGDGCSSLCTLEEGYVQVGKSPLPVNLCGDGLVVVGETCDDRNLIPGDGCTPNCTVELGYKCAACGDASRCDPFCGDGVLTSNEMCDGGPGCVACAIQAGWRCADGSSGPCRDLVGICGDGIIVGNETCDDGATDSGDGCSSTCQVENNFVCDLVTGICSAVCGDGVRSPGVEYCDDNNTLSGDGCSDLCVVEQYFLCIGNSANLPLGSVRPADASNTALLAPKVGAPDTCHEICGDGVRLAGQLACDDGGNVAGDGCSPSCAWELGWACVDGASIRAGVAGLPDAWGASTCAPVCGDGRRIHGEECDDGDDESDDGCSSSCKVEAAFACALGPKTLAYQAAFDADSCLAKVRGGAWYYHDGGNGTSCTLNGSLICIAGVCAPSADRSEDLCFHLLAGSGTCDATPASLPVVDWDAADGCTSSCGDGFRAGIEECDDGNMVLGDGCAPNCKVEVGWYCIMGSVTRADQCTAICGDGIRVPGVEACDDGAWTDGEGDGCSSSCQLEAGFNCSYDQEDRIVGGHCLPLCGDGLWVQGEACDDSNNADLDGCSAKCTIEDGWTCGPQSAPVEAGAEGQCSSGCSDRQAVGRSVCTGICGDGYKVSGEACDDGNTRGADGCSSFCAIEPGYSCEDGNCRTLCGDGVVVGKETCDDGNVFAGDGCANDCLIEQGWQCIKADCSGSFLQQKCALDESGAGSYCEECPPVRHVETRCSHPPCPAVDLTAQCEHWRLVGDGAWLSVDGSNVTSSAAQPCRLSWFGDGYCDMLNNREACSFDGGDCCQRSCACGVERPCFNGVFGGCGNFAGKLGDFRCLDPAPALAATPPTITLSGTHGGASSAFVGTVVATLASDVGAAIYYSLDGSVPAYEGTEATVADGTLYTQPLVVGASVVVRASAVAPGLNAGQAQKAITLMVSTPVVSPIPVPGVITASPTLITVALGTPGATVLYTFTDALGTTEGTGAEFALETSGNLTVRAVKEGALASESVTLQYYMRVADPELPDSGSYITRVPITITSETPLAQILYTICNATGPDAWPNNGNRSVGEIEQRASDATCFPSCRGKCAGGGVPGAVCGDADDLLTCGGTGVCVESYKPVPECFPTRWEAGATTFTAPFELSSTFWGTGTYVTVYARREGLADSAQIVRRFDISSTPPEIFLVESGELPLPASAGGSELGPAASPVSVNFTIPSPGAVIYYTLDGSVPSWPGGSTQRFTGELETNLATGLEASVPARLPQLLNSTRVLVRVLEVNLAPSTLLNVSVAVQVATPTVHLTLNRIRKATGFAPEEEDMREGLALDSFTFPATSLLTTGETFTPLVEVSLLATSPASVTYYKLELGDVTSGAPIHFLPQETFDPTDASWTVYTGQAMQISSAAIVSVVATNPGAIASAVARFTLNVRTLCPAGKETLDGYNPCGDCPVDSHYSRLGGRPYAACVPCPAGTGTVGPSTPSADKCYAFCPPGSKSSTGLNDLLSSVAGGKCGECPVGEYQGKVREAECVRCPFGTTTVLPGATSVVKCAGRFEMSAGGFHTCGVSREGKGVCWGYDGFGQATVPLETYSWLANDQTLTGVREYVWSSLAAGSFHSCGVTEGKGLVCWGQDYAGKTTVPDHLEIEWSAVSASAGYHHTCGLGKQRGSGTQVAVCFGDNAYKQSDVPPGMIWLAVSAGQFHSCGLTQTTNVTEAVCWGDNAYGQATPPSGGTGAAGARSWRQIAAGHYHSCGVLKEGGLECWGSSVYGATDVPADVTTWASVAVGRFHTCGVTYDGSMRCWGATQDGATVPPADVPLWTGVTAGLFHSCGVAPDGVGHCWGRSVYGMTKVPDFRWRSSSSATLQGTFI